MRRILIFFARLLGRLGLGRTVYHIDAGRLVHVTLTALDAASRATLQSVQVFIERPPEGNEKSPFQRLAGQTDANGRVDVVTLVRWSYLVESPDKTVPPPPMAAVLTKPGYREQHISFNLDALREAADTKELNLGSVSMARI